HEVHGDQEELEQPDQHQQKTEDSLQRVDVDDRHFQSRQDGQDASYLPVSGSAYMGGALVLRMHSECLLTNVRPSASAAYTQQVDDRKDDDPDNVDEVPVEPCDFDVESAA